MIRSTRKGVTDGLTGIRNGKRDRRYANRRLRRSMRCRLTRDWLDFLATDR